MTPTSILFLGSFVTAVALPSSVCERCLCTTRAPTWPGIGVEVPGQYAAAEAVFLGTVLQLGVDSTGAFAEFRVTQRRKGAAASSIRIGLPGNGTSCELRLKVREEWLVFARRDSTGYLWTGQCTLTVQRGQAGFVIAALNERPRRTRP